MAKKRKKKILEDKPSNREVIRRCESCGKEVGFFMTNREIYSNAIIKQYCQTCDKMNEFK